MKDDDFELDFDTDDLASDGLSDLGGFHSNALGKSNEGDRESLLNSIPVDVTVEVGSTTMTLGEIKQLNAESVVLLNKSNGEPLDIKVNGKIFARGEIVIAKDQYGIRFSEILSDK
ncbi:flagellar motor switch protein FliN [Vibrio sp.]|nr:flagellar motor switch protein FliN [Vibrio sp.]